MESVPVSLPEEVHFDRFQIGFTCFRVWRIFEIFSAPSDDVTDIGILMGKKVFDRPTRSK